MLKYFDTTIARYASTVKNGIKNIDTKAKMYIYNKA